MAHTRQSRPEYGIYKTVTASQGRKLAVIVLCVPDSFKVEELRHWQPLDARDETLPIECGIYKTVTAHIRQSRPQYGTCKTVTARYGTHKTVTARAWHIQASHGQNVAVTVLCVPYSREVEKFRDWQPLDPCDETLPIEYGTYKTVTARYDTHKTVTARIWHM